MSSDDSRRRLGNYNALPGYSEYGGSVLWLETAFKIAPHYYGRWWNRAWIDGKLQNYPFNKDALLIKGDDLSKDARC